MFYNCKRNDVCWIINFSKHNQSLLYAGNNKRLQVPKGAKQMFFTHPEIVILAMLYDSDAAVSSNGVNKIKQLKQYFTQPTWKFS